MRKKSFSEVCAKLFSTIFDKNGINHKLIGNRMLVRSASKKMLIDFNDMTVNFDTNDQFRMKKFVKVSYNNMIEMRRRYEDKLVALAKFIDKDNYIDLRNSRQDLRSSRTDLRNLRKDLRKQARHDVENRECAILYIDGEFYEDSSHANCLVQYNKVHNIDKEKRTNQRKDNFNEIAEEDHKIAFAHKTNEQTTVDDFMNDADPTDHIFIEEKTLVNMTLAEAAEAFKKQYPDVPIYNDDTNDEEFPSQYKRLAKRRKDFRKMANRMDLRNKRKDFRKIAIHDDYNRECAILYINGEFYEGHKHSDCIIAYQKAHDIKANLSNSSERDFDEDAFFDENKLVFAHKVYDYYSESDEDNDAEKETFIFVEQNSLCNITLDEAVAAFKKQYPGVKIFDDDSNDDDEAYTNEYKQLASKRNDLRKQATHDNYNRECAILYINGEFYEGNSHADCLTAYKEAHSEKSNQDSISRRKNFDKDTLNENKIAFAHEVLDNYSENDYGDKETFIFLERDSLSNLTMDEAVAAFKKQYPGIRIFDDDSNNDEEAYPEEYEQLASKRQDFRKVARRDLRKQADHDVDSRDQAVLYVDGQVFFGETHGECMNEYLSSKDKSLYNTFDRFPTVMRPDLLDRDSITEDNYDDEEEYQEDKDMLTVYDNAKEYAFAHLVGDEIYIEENSLYNLSINVAAKKIKDILGDGYKYYNDDRSDKNDETGYKRLANKR